MSDLGSRSAKHVRSAIEAVLGPRGRVAARRRGFIPNPLQIDMACAVAEALSTPRHLVVEAPGAIGPQLAYLVPIILGSRRSSRFVISTHSAERRARLLEEDIPLLQAVMPQEFTAVRVQSRHAYLGLRRLGETMRKRSTLFADRTTHRRLRRITRWASQTTRGTLEDSPTAPDLALWDRIKSEHGNCMGHRCPTYNTCFYQRDRRRSEHAHILVVDHEMLLADLTVRRRGGSLIPEYDYAIIDEAEQFPAAARARLGLTLSNDQIEHLLDALCDESGLGFLAGCHAQSATGAVVAARRASGTLFGELARWHHTMQARDYASPLPVNNDLSPALRHVHEQLARVRSLLINENDLFEITSFMERCTTLADAVEELLNVERENSVYRLSVALDDHGCTHVTLRAMPASDASDLADGLFNSIGAVILTSDRLSTQAHDPALADFCSTIGLDDAHIMRL